ncbi:hypothetical protein J4423_02850 [Candidatus Pacearchaeota archaeon]|nr:hypothetical protein [Candidatus Pacearchaeota archaeon]
MNTRKYEYVGRILDTLNLNVGEGLRNVEGRLIKLPERDLINIERITSQYSDVFRGATGDEARQLADRFILFLETKTTRGKPVDGTDLEIECLEPPQPVIAEIPYNNP